MWGRGDSVIYQLKSVMANGKRNTFTLYPNKRSKAYLSRVVSLSSLNFSSSFVGVMRVGSRPKISWS